MPEFPIPTVTTDDEPTIKVRINQAWLSFVLGALEPLTTPQEYDQRRAGIYATLSDSVWDGDETQQFNADQEVQKLLLALAIGNLMLEDLITPGALGTVIQSDGTDWIVTMPEFNNLVAKTLAANQVPLTVRGVSGQSAHIVSVRNAVNLELLALSAFGNLGVGGQPQAGVIRLYLNSAGATSAIIDTSAIADTFIRFRRINVGEISVGRRGVDGAFVVSTGGSLSTIGNQLITITSLGLGIGSIAPTAKLDVDSNTIRIRSNKTPTSSADASGNIGDQCADDDYFYRKTNSGWKRAALSSW